MNHEEPVVRPVVQETYGPMDLGGAPMFGGGFINFGYWRGIDLTTAAPLTEEQRIGSQQELYRQVLAAALTARGPAPGELLEVGSGLGTGCALAVREYPGIAVTGLDIHPDQVRRARAGHPGLRFVQGAAEQLPFGDAEFDAVISVEAAQHFPDLAAFATETGRVLRPGGRLALASFFTVDDAPRRAGQLAGLLETFASGLDLARPVTELTRALAKAGLTQVRAESIGDQVWPGWDQWLSRWWPPQSWPRNFLRAYQDRILDYYLVTAILPG
ncbi:SAM-dependent methyltransferase [Streptomyces tateyamensis]|uniref:SAM-dependent methyltransferase n=1 Tax=Streptomyces tateyamensis TaxID=565073 RepID=A0A2V4P6B0_9ACTN|nr:class I SAM-dependent methyltransferase [Streptomyces tateyamensis]PYC78556.1 SAM-dependent methyltransferase [Streptomyces tateyamensis]